MGTMNYSDWAVEFEDRLLTHLQVVIIGRYRRGQTTLMSWIDSVKVGGGRSAIWLTPNQPLFFRFSGSRVPAIDRAWLALLQDSADSSTGLIVTNEHGDPLRVGRTGAALAPLPFLPGSVRG